MAKRMLFRQLFDRISCTYTYLLADATTKNALLIDPVLDLVDRDLTLIDEIGLKLKYLVNTHCHADHITGSGEIKKRLNQDGRRVLSVISKTSGARADVLVSEGDVIECDAVRLEVLATPGHTSGCVSFVQPDKEIVFTGDALLIRGCGRTDFQEGSSNLLYDSIHQKLFSLPNHYKVYPAHDYKGQLVSTIGEEKKFNPRLTKTKEEFIEIMENLNLDKPKLIDIAVPANLLCGVQDL